MEVGDTVKIINIGHIYSTYDRMAERMDLPHWVSGTQGDRFGDSVFTVIDTRGHPGVSSDTICGIDNGVISFVIDSSGIEIIGRRRLTNRRKKSEEYWKAREKIDKKNNLLEKVKEGN